MHLEENTEFDFASREVSSLAIPFPRSVAQNQEISKIILWTINLDVTKYRCSIS